MKTNKKNPVKYLSRVNSTFIVLGLNCQRERERYLEREKKKTIEIQPSPDDIVYYNSV